MTEKPNKQSNKDLLDALGIEVAPVKKKPHSPREERILAGFEEIQRFVEKKGALPTHGEDGDIFERLYAVRLEQMRSSAECQNLLQALDYQALLKDGNHAIESPTAYQSDAELLAELGVKVPQEGDVAFLKHVKTRAEVRAAEEVAKREVCEDFDEFKPLFDAVQQELKSGLREAKRLIANAKIKQGDWFILFGQKAYVASVSQARTHGFDNNDYRLRVIYDNGTESDLLRRSLQKALDRDDTGRRIVMLTAGPLFAGTSNDEDLASGTVYVLRSQSNHPTVQENRAIIHKIGVTGGRVEKRIAHAALDPTYLMAEVEIVATYTLYNINRAKLEHLLHKFFGEAKLDIQINDRFGHPVSPREWFLVPLFIIDEVVDKIKEGTIAQYSYDRESVRLIPNE